MSAIGNLGENILLSAYVPGTCSERTSEWSEIPQGQEVKAFLAITRDTQCGLEHFSGAWIWHPTGSSYECPDPYFTVLCKIYIADEDGGHTFYEYLTKGSDAKSFDCIKNESIPVDERHLFWNNDSNIDIGDAILTSVENGLLIPSSPIPIQLKTDITIVPGPTQLKYFGIYYIFKKNPDINYAPLRYRATGCIGLLNQYVQRDLNTINISTNIIEFLISSGTEDISQMPSIGYFDFENIFSGETYTPISKYIGISGVTLPGEEHKEDCLVIGAAYDYGEIDGFFSIDPSFGNTTQGDIFTSIKKGICGSYFHITGSQATFTEAAVQNMSAYIYHRGTSSVKPAYEIGLIYSSGSAGQRAHSLLAQSNMIIHTTDPDIHFHIISFNEPLPTIVSGETYYICYSISSMNPAKTPVYYCTLKNNYRGFTANFQNFGSFENPLQTEIPNNMMYSMWINVIPTEGGETGTKKTKVGSPINWNWEFPDLGVDTVIRSNAAIGQTRKDWNWAIIGTDTTAFIQVTGSTFADWKWQAETEGGPG